MTTVELAVPPKRLVFPPICANCGRPATEHLTIAKVFDRATTRRGRRRSPGDPTRHAVVRVDVTFCSPCVNRHRETVVETSAAWQMFKTFFSGYVVGAAACILAVYLYFQPYVLGSGDQTLTITPRPREAAMFAVVGAWCVFAVWFGSRRFRIPQGSEVTASFDFERLKTSFWQANRYKYILRNDSFGSAFVEANREARN